IASSLAYGNVKQIKRSISRVMDALGERPAEAIERLEPQQARQRLGRFKHRFHDARDVACLLFFIRHVRAEAGSVEACYLRGAAEPDAESALASFSERALALDHGGLYGRHRLPRDAGVRFFFPSPRSGSACKRLNLYLRWMVRRDGVDLGVWKSVD